MCVCVLNLYQVLLLLLFLANMLLLLHFLPENVSRVETLFDSKAPQSPQMWNQLHNGTHWSALQQSAKSSLTWETQTTHALLASCKSGVIAEQWGQPWIYGQAQRAKSPSQVFAIPSSVSAATSALQGCAQHRKGRLPAHSTAGFSASFLALKTHHMKICSAVSAEHIWKADKFLTASFTGRTHLK